MMELKEKGANAYLKKPIDEKDMVLTVDFHIKKHFEYLKISQLATIDELTGLNNRRSVMNSLRHELAIRKYRDLSIIFFDIDNFKEINDSFGHQSGDLILSAIGSIVKEAVRNYDIAGRYGGDEFLIILPDTNLKKAEYVAEMLRNKIEKNNISTQGTRIFISCSFGVTSLRDNSEYIEKILDMANIENIYNIKDSSSVNWNKIENDKIRIAETLFKMADLSLYKAKQTVCRKCGFASEKSLAFIDGKCPKCFSIDLMPGRNKIVSFE